MFDKLMKKEEGLDHESDSKLKVLEELRDMCSGLMGEKVEKKMSPMGGDMKQVTVAADDEQGLEQGLEMAKEVVPGMESAEEEMSVEEIEAMIQELEEKKRQKMMSV